MYVLLAVPFIWLAGRFWALALLPLQPITQQQSVACRQFGNGFIVVVAILVITGITIASL